jgi:hypothetical protein
MGLKFAQKQKEGKSKGKIWNLIIVIIGMQFTFKDNGQVRFLENPFFLYEE